MTGVLIAVATASICIPVVGPNIPTYYGIIHLQIMLTLDNTLPTSSVRITSLPVSVPSDIRVPAVAWAAT